MTTAAAAEPAACTQGPLANPTQFERVTRYLDIGKTEARLVCGGDTRPVGTGAVVPTIFADVPDDAVIMQVGPILGSDSALILR